MNNLSAIIQLKKASEV